MAEENEHQETETQEEAQESTEKSVDELYQERERAQEEKARQQGWKPLDEYVSEGGDPKDWRPAGEFNLYGEMKNQIQSFEKGYEQKAKNLERYYKAQMEAQKKELEKKLGEAAESGDKDEVVRLNNEIRHLDNQENQPQQDEEPPELKAWNEKNPWIMENSPKANHAKTVFAQAMQQGYDVNTSLRLVDSEVAKHFPEESKASVPSSEKGKGNRGFQKQNKQLSWDDLTDQEKTAYQATKSGWKDLNQFLKAATDARKAEQ